MDKVRFNYQKRYGAKRYAQNFDKDEIYTIKAGKKYNNYQAIQEAREDTEIYPTLEKYGCIDRLKRTVPELEGYGNDLRGITGLRDIFEIQRKADEMWLNLPLDVRREFNHSPEEFVKNGEKWIKEKITELSTVKEEETQKEESTNE